MDAKERYFWDLTGYLVVKNVLATEELETANAAIDYCADRINQGEDNHALDEIFDLDGVGQGKFGPDQPLVPVGDTFGGEQ